MNYSENYSFALPDDESGYDIAPISENFETLDEILTENETTMEEISIKIGTPTESGQTLFSLLGNSGGTGLTAIKSIQYITRACNGSENNASVSIQTVEAQNCIVFFERLSDVTANGCHSVSYELTNDALNLALDNYNGLLGFWIIEFC